MLRDFFATREAHQTVLHFATFSAFMDTRLKKLVMVMNEYGKERRPAFA